MANQLARFSVAMPEDMLGELDGLVARRGQGNRSETIRDLVRDALFDEQVARPSSEVMGILSIFYNHHASDLQAHLHDIQHRYYEQIVSVTHVHVDHDSCVEVILLRGRTKTVRVIANAIIGLKGVEHGHLSLMPVSGTEHSHSHEHTHAHAHEHDAASEDVDTSRPDTGARGNDAAADVPASSPGEGASGAEAHGAPSLGAFDA